MESGNGLALDIWHAIIYTNDDPSQLCYRVLNLLSLFSPNSIYTLIGECVGTGLCNGFSVPSHYQKPIRLPSQKCGKIQRKLYQTSYEFNKDHSRDVSSSWRICNKINTPKHSYTVFSYSNPVMVSYIWKLGQRKFRWWLFGINL